MNPATSRSGFKRNALAMACGAGLLMAVGAQASSGGMGQWREYAARGMTPEYSFASPGELAAAPTLLSNGRQIRSLGEVRLGFDRADALMLSVDFAASPVGYFAPSPVGESSLLSRERSAVTSEFVSSTVGRALGDEGRVSLTAVVARQRYASLGFGAAPWGAREEITGLRGETRHETSSGHGVRVGYEVPLNEYFTFNVAAQSRLDMDAFESYRGVYADAGDFDIPARLQSSLQWNLSRAAAISLGIERVYYSEVDAFTSAALPSRFLSLLGDGSSPAFAWRDLTVYSLEGSVLDRAGAEWVLRYTTRQQPSPTSALLRRALEPEFTDTNLALGYRRTLGDLGNLWLAASYAPSQYFLGALPYSRRGVADGSQLEFEALWSIPF